MIFALNHTLQYQENALLGLGHHQKKNKKKQYSSDDLISQYRAGNFDTSFYQQDTFQMYMYSNEEGEASSIITPQDRELFNQIDR